MTKVRRYIVPCIVLIMVIGIYHNVLAQDPKQPVVVPGKTFLPLRVLARPFSNIYQEPDESSPIVEENVPAFQTFFVYTRPDVSVTSTATEGWYEIGSDVRGTILGWMKAADLMEWKQTMCLAYTHPGGRQPVLLFEELDSLRELLKAPTDNRIQNSEKYYQQINSGDIPADFPIVSREPDDYIDIVEQFYLLPILEHAPFEIGGVEGRLLKIAAATKSERGKEDIASSPESSTGNAGNPSTNPETGMVRDRLAMDIVYVVDMTASMQPYINLTVEAIRDMARWVTKDSDLTQSIRFGLWGYRDSLMLPGIEFTTKNFTPGLQDVSTFERTLNAVNVANVGSEDYPEDMFSGMDKAMRETQWTEGAMHVIVLIGDAPAHEPGHDWNQSGQSANTLRDFANPPDSYYVLALHIKDSQAQEFWDLTETQFRTLSQNPGVETSSYWNVAAEDRRGFATVSKAIAEGLAHFVKSAKAGAIVVSPSSQPPSSSGAPTSDETIEDKVMQLGYAALVEWIGREKGAKAPRDVTAWITDKDLLDPDIQALDVRILLSKNELDSLKTVLQEIMTAGRRGIIGGEDFFTALQSVPSVASRAGDQIKSAQNIAESGLMPEFMMDLPYQSRIMNMSNELWSSWGVDQQEEFLNEVDAKIKLYAAIHSTPNGWISLNEGDDPSEYVHPVSLESLP